METETPRILSEYKQLMFRIDSFYLLIISDVRLGHLLLMFSYPERYMPENLHVEYIY